MVSIFRETWERRQLLTCRNNKIPWTKRKLFFVVKKYFDGK